MNLSILDAVDAFEKSEFLDYLRRLRDKLRETCDDHLKAIDLIIDIVDSADSATWRYVAKDVISRAMRAGRMKFVGWKVDHD